MEAKLVVVAGKVTKSVVALDLPSVLGRGREAKLRIGDSTISRKHCEMTEKDGLIMLHDLGSLNGTLVDGRRIKEAPLPPSAEFTIGPLTFRVEYEYSGDLSALPEPVLADDASMVKGPSSGLQVLDAAPLNTLETGPSASTSDDFAILNTPTAASGPDLLDDEEIAMAVESSALAARALESDVHPADPEKS